MSVTFTVNGERRTVEVPEDTPLLWVLRDTLQLKGTKYSCGVAVCGACTVDVDGQAVRACVTPVSAVQDGRVTTIESLGGEGLHTLQRIWIEEEVPQCGYCQPGFLMQAALLLERTPEPTDAEIDREMAGNLCRCGTYSRVRRAIHRAARERKEAGHG
ncbi:MAG: (2Fe-2S)-binding protein [Longimicrobiales bacterium]|nr:(2Fe-2S)-binding protein [Longimicrobiales bacterium]